MADTKKATVAVEVPEGVKPEDLSKLLASFQKQRVNTKKHDKAVAQATKRLKLAHKDEYAKFVAEELKKV